MLAYYFSHIKKNSYNMTAYLSGLCVNIVTDKYICPIVGNYHMTQQL